jgi:hypothetical protein
VDAALSKKAELALLRHERMAAISQLEESMQKRIQEGLEHDMTP